MRPLNKGPRPLKPDGTPITVTEYGEWRAQLIKRIGYYCVYCNIPLSHSLEVEHVSPKNPPSGTTAGSLLDWDNMLIACGPCNNAKGNSPVNLNQLYFPERHNTLLPFDFEIDAAHPDHAIVTSANGLTTSQARKAEATIAMMKLGNIDLRNKVVDIRTIRRKDALMMARELYKLFQDIKTELPQQVGRVAHSIANVAKGYGFFGCWFRIFRQEPEVLTALLDTNIIPGTAQDCFDPNADYVFLPRNPTNTTDPI